MEQAILVGVKSHDLQLQGHMHNPAQPTPCYSSGTIAPSQSLVSLVVLFLKNCILFRLLDADEKLRIHRADAPDIWTTRRPPSTPRL